MPRVIVALAAAGASYQLDRILQTGKASVAISAGSRWAACTAVGAWFQSYLSAVMRVLFSSSTADTASWRNHQANMPSGIT